jgi:hypothetical protein
MNGLAHMLSRAEAKERFATVLQQSTTGGSNRVVWDISVGKNPSNSAHVNSWDQAQTCYNPMTQQPTACTDGGYILTQVNANQLLGYSPAQIAKLTSPIGTTKPQARLKVARVKDVAATTTVDESARGLKVLFTDASLCPSGNCTKTLRVTNASAATCPTTFDTDNSTPLTLINNKAEHTFTLAAGVWKGSFCAQLSVTDNATGLKSTRTFPINLTKRNTRPTTTGDAIPATGTTGTLISINSAFTVADDDDAATALKVLIVWGDGTSTTVNANADGTVTASKTYNVAKTYNVRITVIDTKGGRTRVTESITVSAP